VVVADPEELYFISSLRLCRAPKRLGGREEKASLSGQDARSHVEGVKKILKILSLALGCSRCLRKTLSSSSSIAILRSRSLVSLVTAVTVPPACCPSRLHYGGSYFAIVSPLQQIPPCCSKTR
ncbi:hypothetical protein HAX54_037129, partial [Datura stramonium]|nr:hypothetical protein [Datura stramonium]